ncbi:MAG: chloride channel protein [Gammaproteobacteria bacterium]
MILTPLRNFLERAHTALAGARAQPLLALLGLACGLLAGAVVILFRFFIESMQSGLLPGGDPENYEALSISTRLIFSIGGGVILGLLFYLVSRPPLRVGVIHVMERLAYHEGHLPLRNAVMQFVGGALSIIAGHSVGREGPSVHLGAAGASLMGQRLGLPNNSIRTLVACGVAAAIAASFNTPLAGVIFAMEVVMMEYTISGFTPVILSAVSATALNRAVLQDSHAFVVPELTLSTLWELPVIALMGVVAGAVAAGFIVSLKKITPQAQRIPIALRLPLAGAGVGLCAAVAPQVMGVGYDTVNAALVGEIALATVVIILGFKFLATVICIGLTLPGGLIGPTLFMGALLGCATGLLAGYFPIPQSEAGLYAILGMGAMMGAVLQAPLAALLAIVELTGNINIIFPGMLAIISATLACKEWFGQTSVYLSQIEGIGLIYRNDPMSQSLRRLALRSVLNPSFAMVQPTIGREQARKLLIESSPHWLILSLEDRHVLMPAADLARYLEESEEEEIRLMEVPSRRQQLVAVRQQATLQQALDKLDESGAEAAYAIEPIGTAADRIYGVATRQEITDGYRLRASSYFF